MTLVFFKAMRPYDKTTGFFENYHWHNGVCGPMSIKEAQRLNAAMGGRILTIDLPHINSLQAFLEAVGAEDSTILNREGDGQTLSEIAGPLKGNNDPQNLVKKILDSNPKPPYEKRYDDSGDDRKERPDRNVEIPAIPTEVIMSMEKASLETLAKAEGIEVPAYAIQFKELTDAKNEDSFDFTEHIGTERNSLSMLRAYMLMKLAQ